jgi:hypothetical protein
MEEEEVQYWCCHMVDFAHVTCRQGLAVQLPPLIFLFSSFLQEISGEGGKRNLKAPFDQKDKIFQIIFGFVTCKFYIYIFILFF